MTHETDRFADAARARRLEIQVAVQSRYGDVSERRKVLLDLYEQLTLSYLKAADDVQTRGLRETYVNGSQRTTRKNICLDQMMKLTAALTKLLGEILPDSKKADAPPDDEAGEDVELDDY